MRRVLLQRHAFLDNALCERGSIVPISDRVAMAAYMTLQDDVSPAAASTPDKTVTVHVHQATHEVDIDVGGVEMRIDHAALSVERD